MNNLIIAPILLPMILGSILILFTQKIHIQRILAALTAIALLFVSFYLAYVVYLSPDQIITLELGSWPAPFGIVLVADMFASLMVILASLIGLVCLFFAFKTIIHERQKYYFYPFYFFLLTGVNGAFLTGDLFNLFVFFEVMLISSYVLIVFGGTAYQLRESFKYVVINIFSSILFIVAIAYIYGITGSLNLADIAVKVAVLEQQGVINVIAILLLIVFGLKGALFPLYFWLPKSYYGPPSAIAALFGGLLTKVGIYAIIRVFTLIFTHNPEFTHNVILIIAGLTMFFGVLGAVSQFNFKRILSYHIISQVGYMVMGLGIYTPLAVAGAIYYITHHIIVKSALFLFAGVTQKLTGTYELNEMGGVIKSYPWLGWLFFITALSLAGIPPLSGFFSKFALIIAGIQEEQYFIVFVSLLVGLLTLYSMMKIFNNVFWGEEQYLDEKTTVKNANWLLIPIVPLVLLTITLGLAAEPIFQYSLGIAEQILEPSNYINSVLNEY
ncbi:Na(+) H(+) antiporter subunit D [Candidatus Syntrophocurvum alkaliphilum]|uniref:Na(+) H(+) antiporter subunit D n=1 Tax=Candidatus Syntrophocurvum alkaliphilum TaxID=2293317 RepID=A0A6I6D9A1_9FIRM|nr:Na+/H+ antiporter subunit D [Candidatus Syntrophocurvum alkaliphilum]QGT99425.1 Na(+) H(+) antiporter subunit D [Candidatus Syntrophocurvum alkaliphilum]